MQLAVNKRCLQGMVEVNLHFAVWMDGIENGKTVKKLRGGWVFAESRKNKKKKKGKAAVADQQAGERESPLGPAAAVDSSNLAENAATAVQPPEASALSQEASPNPAEASTDAQAPLEDNDLEAGEAEADGDSKVRFFKIHSRLQFS